MVRLRTVALALLAFFCSSSLLTAQSVLQFPRAISSSGVFTGLAVGNPTTTQASVTFVAYQADGTLLGGGQNPVTVTIPAGGQYARLIPEIFGAANFNGWVQATSSTSGLTGFFLNGNSALTDFDGAGSRSPGTDFVLPIAVEDSIARTEVTLVNVNVEAAVVTVTLYASDGRVILAKDITLAARSLARQTLVNLLGAVDFSAASHLTLRANRPIVAHEVVADFQIAGTSLRRETAALSGHALTSAVSHVLPQFATGGNWSSVVGLVNGSNAAQDVTLTAYKDDGTLWSLPSNPKTVTLPGNGGMRETVENLFGFPSGTLNSGWIQVSPSQGSLATYIGYGNNLTPSFALVEGVETNIAARFSVFSQVAEGAGYYTGVTVVNPGPGSADIEFYTLRADGGTVGRTTLTLAPNQKVARLFRELLPVTFQQTGGWGFVRSSSPVVAAVLFGSSNGYALASVPQQIPAGDFVPPAQTTGAIAGTVRSSGSGLADVQVTLSGPVNTTFTTESSGQFVFTQLPAGQYKVTAARTGAVIAPTERNITIDRQNVDGVDFTAGAVTSANSPVIDFISPVSAFAGNSPLSIRVFGKNFTPASVVRVNNQPVPTSFVSAVELSAVVPGTSLTQPATLKVSAETPPPGGGVSSSADFTVNPVPSNPLIVGSAAVGSFPAGVAIDASRNRALITNESGDSVTVLDLGTRQTVTEIHVGRSPEGIDIHPGKDIALVANVGSNDVSIIDLKTNTVTQTIRVGRGPLGLAVNSDTNRAYVVNGDDSNVTIINLDTMAAIGTMAAGSRPSNIAVNTRTNQGIVSNRGGNSVTVLNLATGTGSTISVGEFPRGVAINPDTNLGVVANAGGDSISIVDLTLMTAVTVKVGSGPTGVAIHRGTNSVLVTNSGVTRDNPGLGNASSVSVINLDTREEVASVAAGSAAYGVGVDQDRQIAAVANFGSNNVTIIRIPNPVPRITSVEPKTFPTGGGSFTVTVKGSGFVSTSVITLNRQALPTVFVSSTELKGVVSAAMVDQLLQVHSIGIGNGKATISPAVQTIEFNIEVTNPGPGGGSNLPSADPTTTQIQPQNLVPTLLSLSPTQTQAGVADLTLILNGNNFNVTSIINFAGLQFSPTSSSLQSLTVVIPKAQLVAGVFPVSVTNPGPTGGLSALLSFTVTLPANPPPIVTTVTPSSVPVGSGAVTVVVQGTGFINSTTGTLAGVTGVLSGSSMSFAVPASPTAVVGTLNGFISNPAPGGGTAPFSVNVLNPAPTVSGFTPTSAGVGASATALQITGTNFVTSSQVTFGGTPIATGFVSSAALTATIPSALLTASGSFAIGVTNPGPGGGSSSGGNFAVLPIPTLSSISPASGTQGTTVNVTLTGTNFVAGATTINVSGGGVSIGQIVSAGTTGLSTSFTIDAAATPGLRSVTVTTSAGTSNAVSFNVVAAPPTLSSINPASGTQGTAVPVTLTGTNFTAGASVSISSADVTVGTVTVVDSTTIATTFTINAAATAGARSVTVSTSAGNSNAVSFTVLAAQPTLSSINPASGTQGTAVPVTLTGTNFTVGASVSTNSADVTVGTVTVVNSATITATFTISATATAGARSVTVFTSAGSSNAVSFTVLAAAPTLSSINPASGTQGTAVPVTLTGTNFAAGASVSINSADVTVGTVTVANATTITTTLTISATATAGARNVTVTTSAGTSGAVTFTVVGAGPALSSINPSSGLQGDVVPVTLSGSNFLAGASVTVSGSGVGVGTVNVVSATTLTTTFTINSLAASGARNVTVTTSAGTSGAVTFTVTAGANLVSGFSAAANPGGVWSYGFTPTLGGAFTVYNSNAPDTSLPSGFQRWFATALGNDPAVVRNNTGSNYTHTNGILFPTNMLHFHPGSSGQYSVIRWTAPAAGNYAIQGSFMGLNPQPTTTDVHVRRNSLADLFSANISNYNVPVPYSVIVFVSAGDTIDFEVGFGSNLDYTFDSTGVSGTITPVSTIPAPTLSAISPSSGLTGTTVPVTLTGTDFVIGSTTVAVSGAGVSVGPVNVVSSTSLTASLTIAPGAATGARNVTVTTPGGTSGPQIFTVNLNAPTLTSVAPAQGVQGTTVPVTLTGTDFIAGASVAINSADVTVGPVTVVSPTSITTTFTISSTAAVGIRNVTVTTGGGTSNAQVFTVQMAGPVSWWRGEGNVSDTLGANNPSASNNVSFIPAAFGTGFTFGSGGFVDIPQGASLANQQYTLSAWVRPDGPGPNNDVAGSVIINENIDNTHALLVSWRALDGRFFFQFGTADGASLVSTNSFPTGQFYLVDATYDGSTFKLFVNGNLEAQQAGPRAIIYSTNAWTIGAASPNIRVQNFPRTWNGVIDEVQVFSRALSTSEIQAQFSALSPPTLLTISPGTGAPGQTVPVTLTGTNFQTGATTVAISGTGVSVGAVTVTSATSLTTTFAIASGAALTSRNVTVTTAGGTSGSVGFDVVSTFPGSVFSGSVSTDWSDPANWQPAGVPTASADVLIPAAATRQPTLTANAFVLNLTVENGATLNTAGFNLTVAGNVDAGTTITGTGTVIMSGTGTIKGILPNVQVTGTATFAAGSTPTINGNLTVTSGSLDLADATVTVTGNFTTNGSGQLKMLNAAGVMTVNGNVLFQGGNEDTLLTAGVLNVKGNFSQVSASSGAGNTFNPTGTHRVVFNGGTGQTISFSNPASDQGNSHFQNLQIANTSGGVSFLTTTQINGNLDVTTATIVTGNVTVFVSGNVSTAAGSNIDVTTLALNGTTALTGAISITNLVVMGGVTVNGATTLTGNLTISSGSVDISDKTLTVTGNFTTNGSGQVKMQNAASVLTVNGNVLFQGGNEDTLLTAGVLNVKGNFSQVSASSGAGNTFAVSGTHRVVFNGGTGQTISFTNPASDQGNSHFQNLEIANASGGVSFLTTTQINGNLDVTTATIVIGNVTVFVSGNVSTAAGSGINVTTLTLNGTTALTGAVSITNLVVSGGVTVSGATTLTGNLTISSGSVDISDKTLTVTGNFTTNGSGQVKMQNAASVLTVNGNVLFQGGNEDTLLTAGVLNVKGNFSQVSASSGAGNTFAVSGTHRVVLNGGTGQTISFSNPASDQGNSHFQNLQIANTSGGVSFLTTTQINGNLDVTTATIVTGNVTVFVSGNVSTAAGSGINVTTLTLNGTTALTGAVSITNLVVSGGVTVSGATTLTGNLTISSGSVDISDKTLAVTGNFTTNGSGQVKMQNAASVLTVNGNVLFQGGNEDTLLTAGVLNVKGNFSQVSASSGAGNTFAVSGTHRVVFNGGTGQTISFSNPASDQGNSHFQNLQIANTSGGVSFLTTTQINGNLDVLTATPVSGNVTVTVNGNLTKLCTSTVTVTNLIVIGTTTTLCPADRTWVGGTPGNLTDWATASNWSPAGQPTATQSVQIPVTANQPVLTANAVAGDLTLDPGAILNTSSFTITVSGNLSGGSITGAGNVVMNGSSKTILGVVPNLTVTGTVAAGGSLTVNGDLTASSGTFDVNGQTVVVTGNFSTASSGLLKMQNVAGVLTVNGAATFGGGDTTGLLTAGTLNLKGNFAANSSSLTNFAPSGTHLTVLNGTSTQTLSVSFPGPTNSRFQNLQLSNTAGAVFSTNTQINGNFDVTVAGGVTGAGTVTVTGILTTAASSSVTTAGMTLGGAMTVNGAFSPITTTFTGTSQTIQAGLGYLNVVVTGTAAFSGATTVTGNLTVSGGSLDLAGMTVTVTGNFTTTSSGLLKMQNVAGVLTVNGAATFGGGDTTGLLTAGTLNAKGSFTTNTSSLTNFAPSGTYLTVLNGTASQTVSMAFPGATNSRFQNLLLTNTAGAVFSSNIQINGNFDVTVAAAVSGAGTLTIVGNLTTAAGSAVTVAAVTLTGAMTIGGTFTPVTTTFVGTNQTIQSGLGYQNIVLAGTGTAAFSSSTTVSGNLTVSSGTFDLAGMTLTLGSFNTGSSGVLKMQNPAGLLRVLGATLFGGGDTTGLLTAGTLNAKGSFTTNTSSLTNFAASGTHLTVLDGTASQTVSMAFPGATNSRFQNLLLTNTAGVVLSSNIQINGNFDVTVAAAVSGSGTLTIVGNLTTAAGSAVTVAAVTLTGAMTIGGTFTPVTTTFVGTNQTIQSGLGYQNIVLAGTGTAAFSSSTTVSGNLTVSSGTFDLAGMTLTLGSFNTGSSGVLKMQNPSGVLTVNGATLFGGGDTTGLLAAGTLNAKGSFTTNTSSLTNFAASGTHLTVLNGTASQTVSMAFPGATNSRFQDLRLTNTAGVVFSSNIQINGNFDVTVAGTVTGATTVTVVGNLTTASGATVATTGVTLGGALTAGGPFTPTTTTFVGTSQTIPAGLGYQNVIVTGTAAFVATTTMTGNLTISSGSLDLAGTSVTVNGNFSATGSGVLKMQNPSGALTINGTTLFGGGDTTGLLTAGTLNVKGSFTSNTSSLTNFAASGTHLTVLNGTSAQTLSVAFPGPTNSRFQNLQLSQTAGAVFSTNTQINGNFNVTVASAVSGAGTITLVGNLTTPAGSSVTTAGMTLGGAMSVNGTFAPQLTTFAGTNQTIQAGLSYQNVTITGTAAFPVSQFAIPIFGNLTVVGQLDLAAGAVTVAGNFTTTSGGRLKMQNSSGVLQVTGNATFNGGDTSGLLTNGTLYLLGNFSSTSSSLTNFAPSGAHQTVFAGTATQTLNVAFPGSTNNRFRDLLVTNTVGVSLLSNAVVTGEFDAGAISPKVKIIGNGKTLTVANIDLYGVDLDHVLLVINWNLVGPMYFDYVDLRNYPDAATRITITATAANEYFNGINFVDGVPTVGRLVNATDTDGGRDFVLDIESNLNPALADAKTVENNGATVNWIPVPVTYLAPVNYPVGTFSRSVDKGDFNGDGKLDLVVANRTTNNVSVLLGNGNGTFQTAVNYTTSSAGRTSPHPRFVKVADFNLDGRADLAVANEDTRDISILLGNGNGTFQTAVHYVTDDGPSSIAVGDFNGDGKPDLVVTNGVADLFADTFSILLGNGNGTFQTAVTYPTGGEAPRSVVVADFNADGKQDLATANGFDDNLSVYLGNGNGTFQTAVNYAAGLEPYSLVTADFNADGKADLAVANRDDNSVKVYFGNGNGTFQAGIPYSTGTSPQFLTVGDFNADGVADLATADCGFCNQGSDTVSVLLGNGNGTFNYPNQFPVGTAPFAVVGGDFNGDGKLDLAVANRNSNNVSILLWTAAVP